MRKLSIILVFVLMLSVLSGCGSITNKNQDKKSYNPTDLIEEPIQKNPMDEGKNDSEEENNYEENNVLDEPVIINPPQEQIEPEPIYEIDTEDENKENLNESDKKETEVLEPTIPNPTGSEDETLLRRNSREFNQSLIDYVKENGYSNKNFMISPLSLRAAMCLATVGAARGSETEDVLLKGLGFEDYNDMLKWYKNILNGIDDFYSNLEDMKSMQEEYDKWGMNSENNELDWAYRIANSAWINSDFPFVFTEEYKKEIYDLFEAEARVENGSEISKAVGDWAEEKTNGFIKNLNVDLSNVPASLVNAVYFKSAWRDKFSPTDRINEFRTFDDKKVEKDYMHNTEYYNYYKDNQTELVIVPMEGNVQAVFVVGDETNVFEKINQSERKEVHLTLPKFEINSRFEKSILKNYFVENGYSLPFSDLADFSYMTGNNDFEIGDICQVTRIKTDEDGVEAAAITVITMKTNALIEKPQPIEFIIDTAFSFYILDGNNNNEVLFYGQLVE